jgi:cytochrome c biogenesis protein CcmG/thiol:disulfide interchange protein DsbE
LPLLIVGTIVGGLFYIEQRRSSRSGTNNGFGTVALPTALNSTGRSASSDVGRAAPDFLLETPAGAQFRLSDLHGKPLLVNFWATWCTECRQELPLIVKAYDANKTLGFAVVAVNLQENSDQIAQFAQEFGMTFPIVIDRTGGVGDAWHIGGPTQGIPSSYFIDHDGIVQARVFGPLTQETLADSLRKIAVGQ